LRIGKPIEEGAEIHARRCSKFQGIRKGELMRTSQMAEICTLEYSRSLPRACHKPPRHRIPLAGNLNGLFGGLMSLLRYLAPAALAVSAFAAPPNFSTDYDALLQGVTEITAPGAPGSVSAFGPNAFALVAGKEGRSTRSAVAAAAHWEKGRVVVFGHDGYLAAVTHEGTARLLGNAVVWVSAGKPKPRVVVRGPRILAEHLRSGGLPVEDPGSSWLNELGRAHVLCLDARTLRTADEVKAVGDWVRRGGGLVTAGTGWGWASLNPGKNLPNDFLGNQLLAPAGIVFGGGTPEKTTGDGYTAGGDLALLNASSALDALLSQNAGGKVTPADATQASASVAEALRSVPSADTLLLPKLAALQNRPEAQIIPAPGKPLRATDGIARLLLTRVVQTLKDTPPAMVRPHPAADNFPGAVPPSAPRVKDRIVTINLSVPDWHSTGLYAPPGVPIKVQLPQGATNEGLSIRIGCHSDSLWHLEKWERVPEITRTDKLSAPETTVASAFGGLIYIVVPKDGSAGEVKISVSGAVEVPRFTLGQTTLADWRSRIRNAPGPWAELETRKVILTIPATAVRSLDDPEALLRFWDAALDNIADLASISRDRKRPERIVADVQISAGYMHSGYPIMTHLDVATKAVSTDELKVSGWGYWHELGHNHQVSDWTFSGTGEVTCNLFSLYVCETLCGIAPGQGHDALVPAKVAERLRKHLATRAVFERWKDDPFLALTMYDQLRAAFGWDAYKKVFAEYRDLPKGERPKSDDEKRDQWLVRFSRVAGRNLGPFFQAWGVPTSESARRSIANLPDWMPEDWPNPQSGQPTQAAQL
jgi:hypothetical protein